MRIRTLILAGLAMAGLYGLTAARNRTEAEDAFDLAWRVEHARGAELLHPHHLAYLPAMRPLCAAASALAGRPVRAHPVLAAAGAVCAGGAVALFALLLGGPLGAGRGRAWAAAAGLAFSYGFWRYAAEAEIYAPMLLFALASWALAARADRPVRAALSGAVGGVALLFHVFAAIPVLAAVPLWLALRGRWRPAAVHFASAAALAAAVYAAAGLSPRGEAANGDALRREAGVRAGALAKGAVAFGQTVVSGNFLFAQPRFAAEMQRRYPLRMLEEEVFMGRHARPWMRVVPWATLAALLAAAAAVLAAGLRARRRPPEERPAAGDDPGARRAALAAGLTWLVLHAGLLLVKEPGNPELWIAALPAAWIVAASLAAMARVPAGPALALAAALAAHNGAGGMALLRDPAGDYNAAKAAPIRRVARAGDRVLTAGGPVFFRHLRYGCPAEVTDLWTAGPAQRPADGARVILAGDVFQPPAALKARFHDAADRIEAFAASVRGRAAEVCADEFGGVFLLANPPATAVPGDAPPPSAPPGKEN